MSISSVLYARAKDRYPKGKVAACVTELVEADLEQAGVSPDDPGMPKVRRVIGTRVGRGRSVGLPGVTYRRARLHAAKLGMSLSGYVSKVVLADVEKPKVVKVHVQVRGQAASEPLAKPAPPPPRPQRRREDDARCAEALALANLEPGGVQLL